MNRKAYYRQAAKLTRRPRMLHFTRYHFEGSFKFACGGIKAEGKGFSITFGPAGRRTQLT